MASSRQFFSALEGYLPANEIDALELSISKKLDLVQVAAADRAFGILRELTNEYADVIAKIARQQITLGISQLELPLEELCRKFLPNEENAKRIAAETCDFIKNQLQTTEQSFYEIKKQIPDFIITKINDIKSGTTLQVSFSFELRCESIVSDYATPITEKFSDINDEIDDAIINEIGEEIENRYERQSSILIELESDLKKFIETSPVVKNRAIELQEQEDFLSGIITDRLIAEKLPLDEMNFRLKKEMAPYHQSYEGILDEEMDIVIKKWREKNNSSSMIEFMDFEGIKTRIKTEFTSNMVIAGLQKRREINTQLHSPVILNEEERNKINVGMRSLINKAREYELEKLLAIEMIHIKDHQGAAATENFRRFIGDLPESLQNYFHNKNSLDDLEKNLKTWQPSMADLAGLSVSVKNVESLHEYKNTYLQHTEALAKQKQLEATQKVAQEKQHRLEEVSKKSDINEAKVNTLVGCFKLSDKPGIFNVVLGSSNLATLNEVLQRVNLPDNALEFQRMKLQAIKDRIEILSQTTNTPSSPAKPRF